MFVFSPKERSSQLFSTELADAPTASEDVCMRHQDKLRSISAYFSMMQHTTIHLLRWKRCHNVKRFCVCVYGAPVGCYRNNDDPTYPHKPRDKFMSPMQWHSERNMILLSNMAQFPLVDHSSFRLFSPENIRYWCQYQLRTQRSTRFRLV